MLNVLREDEGWNSWRCTSCSALITEWDNDSWYCVGTNHCRWRHAVRWTDASGRDSLCVVTCRACLMLGTISHRLATYPETRELVENVLEAVVRQLNRMHMEHERSGAATVLQHMVQLRAIADAVERPGTGPSSPPRTPPDTENPPWSTWWPDPPPPQHTPRLDTPGSAPAGT